MPLDLTVIILTKNESLHIDRALENLSGLAKRVVVVDSFSTDSTVEIARRRGADVLQNKFVNQAKQFQWALDNIPIDTHWVMRLDADEVIELDLYHELMEKLPKLPQNIVGINLKRKHIFLGKWVRHGGRYPLLMLRIWRRGHGFMEDRWMDEHIMVRGGQTITLSGSFADHNLNNLSYFTAKHNDYATREAVEILIQRHQLLIRDSDELHAEGSSFQASFKRKVKNEIYNKIPFTLSAFMYFCWRYFFQLGILDGRTGLVYHFLQGYWYRFLVGAKAMELDSSLISLRDKTEKISKIRELTGIDLTQPRQ